MKYFRFSVVYYENIDVRGHFYGPYDRRVEEAVRDLDKAISRIVQKVESGNGASNGINLAVMSDHGMTEVSTQKSINVSQTLEEGDCNVTLISYPISFIWPNPGKEQLVGDGHVDSQHLYWY